MRRRRRSNQSPWHLRRRRQSNAGTSENCFTWKSSPRQRARIWLGLADLLAVLCTLLFFALIYLLVSPFKQGFFCDDQSIFKPFKTNTVQMWHLGLYGVLGPLLLFLFVELWVTHPYGSDEQRRKRRKAYGGSIFHTSFLFLLGIASTFLLVEVGKRSFGRLRPHFIQVCQPNWSKIHCYDIVKSCLGNDTDAIKEARISFPSGHSAIVTYSFIFLIVYLEARFICVSVRFLKPILQCACVCIALFTCISRVTDNMHHATDVIAGAIIGGLVAILITTRVGSILWTYGIYSTNKSDPYVSSNCAPKNKSTDSTVYNISKGNEKNQSFTGQRDSTISGHDTTESTYEFNIGPRQPEVHISLGTLGT